MAQNGVQIGGRTCEQTKGDRDVKITGFVGLIEVDVISYVKN